MYLRGSTYPSPYSHLDPQKTDIYFAEEEDDSVHPLLLLTLIPLALCYCVTIWLLVKAVITLCYKPEDEYEDEESLPSPY